MKKKLFRTACVAAVLAMALSFAGCGKDEDNSSSSSRDNKESSAPASTKSSSDSDSGDYETVEDYVNSPEFQSQLSSLESSIEGSGMKMKIEAEGNTLIYNYTYETMAKADFDDASVKALEDGLEAESTTFETVANSLKTATGQKDSVVKIVYLSSDGQVVAEKEFKAN